MYLTDGSPETMALAGGGKEWIARPPSALPRVEQELWLALGGDREVWTLQGGSGDPFWHRIVLIRSAPASQFDVLHSLLVRGLSLQGPVACLALRGKDFHGQHGRPWSALPGNIHLSAVVFPDVSAAEFGISLTMLPAVAVVDAIRGASNGVLNPGVKWINDILISRRKVSGVLATTRIQGDRLASAVLGAGLNVETAPEVPPTPFVPAAGCLRDFSRAEGISLPVLFQELLHALGRRYRELLDRGPEPLYRSYLEMSLVLGQEVVIWEEGAAKGDPSSWPPPVARGTVTEIDRNLGLRLAGRRDPVTRGRLAFAESCREFSLIS